ncbi:MAG: thioredoxin-dependent thiol peroxidase [Gemmatimonadota bacterium]
MLTTGTMAPLFTLPDDSGNRVSLKSLRGNPVVLFFYPKDNTPGCTAEACSFRNRWAAVRKNGALVFGISPDPEASHRKFRTRFKLPFPLLVDADHAVAEAYEVWAEKRLFGHRYFGILRTTFLIDPKGRIGKIFERVKPLGHAGLVLEALNA